MRAPYPYFGGKSRIAPEIWKRFGTVKHYIEPFAGSLAVYLSCPVAQRPDRITFNDLDGMITNFWRAVLSDPDGVARYASRPRSEIDMIAIHAEIQKGREDLTLSLMRDPSFYDVKIAGWWVWGMGTAIGDRWLQVFKDPETIRAAMPKLEPSGVHTQYEGGLQAWMQDLATHLQGARIMCGDWSRTVTDSVIYYRDWNTAIFLDPPYKGEGRRQDIYSFDLEEKDLHQELTDFCLLNGEKMKIAICGYEGDFDLPDTWECLSWKSGGGYAHVGGQGASNRDRERIWFSPVCGGDEEESGSSLF